MDYKLMIHVYYNKNYMCVTRPIKMIVRTLYVNDYDRENK